MLDESWTSIEALCFVCCMIIVLVRGNKPHENSSYNIIILEQNRLIPLRKKKETKKSRRLKPSVEVRFLFCFLAFLHFNDFFPSFILSISRSRPQEENPIVWEKLDEAAKKNTMLRTVVIIKGRNTMRSWAVILIFLRSFKNEPKWSTNQRHSQEFLNTGQYALVKGISSSIL